jgi:hypothetical protein
MWKQHVFYESRPYNFIITLGGQLYRVLEGVPTIMIPLISTKKCRKVVYYNQIFFLFMVQLECERKIIATTKSFARGLSTQKQHVDNIIEENKDIFASPIGVPFYIQVNHSIDYKPNAPLPSDSVYMHSFMENEEIIW